MSDDKDRESERWVMDVAQGSGIDTRPLSVALEIKTFLNTLKDHGTSIDYGCGMGQADLHVKINGEEWHVAVKRSGIPNDGREV